MSHITRVYVHFIDASETGMLMEFGVGYNIFAVCGFQKPEAGCEKQIDEIDENHPQRNREWV